MFWKGRREKREVASRGRDWALWLVRDFGDDAEAELERRLYDKAGRSAQTRAIYLRARRELRLIRRAAHPRRLTLGGLIAAAVRIAAPSQAPRKSRRGRS